MADTLKSSNVTDHAYASPDPIRQPWARCGVKDANGKACGLSEAAHAETLTPYRPNSQPFDPLGGASRGVGRCTCLVGPGTNPGCPVHP